MIRKFMGLCLVFCLIGMPSAFGQDSRGEVTADLCNSRSIIEDELAAFFAAFVEAVLLYDDVDGDDLPEIASIALITEVACDEDETEEEVRALTGFLNLKDETIDAYDANLTAVGNEPQAAALADYDNAIAALMVVSQQVQNTVAQILSENGITLTGSYQFIEVDLVARDSENPYAGDGDIDGDGATNADEYAAALADNGGTADIFALDLFILSAFDAALFGSGGGGGGGGGGCLIATISLGTPLANELGTLRNFRESYLVSNPVGSAIAGMYYRMSPTVAKNATSGSLTETIARAIMAPVVLVVQGVMAFPAVVFIPFSFLLYRRKLARSRG